MNSNVQLIAEASRVSQFLQAAQRSNISEKVLFDRKPTFCILLFFPHFKRLSGLQDADFFYCEGK